MKQTDPLRARLFGYGVPYRVRWTATAVEPLPTDAAIEAKALALALEQLLGQEPFGQKSSAENPSADPATDGDDVWAVSVPFGRCGLEGRPLEYLRVYNAAEAYVDCMGPEGVQAKSVGPDETVRLDPGFVLRLRARPQPGARVLVAFQTEDRTPLLGHAAPFTLDGVVPTAYDDRLQVGHAAFAAMEGLAADEDSAYQAVLKAFFGDMEKALKTRQDVAQLRQKAQQEGAYDGDLAALFARQQALLSRDVLQRIAAADSDIYRFPGMFGGVAPLMSLVD